MTPWRSSIPVGPGEGLDHDSVASFDNLAAVPKSVLTGRLGELGAPGGVAASATPPLLLPTADAAADHGWAGAGRR